MSKLEEKITHGMYDRGVGSLKKHRPEAVFSISAGNEGLCVDIPGGVGVQFHPGSVARQKLVISLGADHRAVVSAQPQRRQVQLAACLTAGVL